MKPMLSIAMETQKVNKQALRRIKIIHLKIYYASLRLHYVHMLDFRINSLPLYLPLPLPLALSPALVEQDN